MKSRKPLRIIFASLLFMAAAIYIFRLIPDIDPHTFLLLSFERWLLVISLFLIVQLLNVLYFKLILTRMCNIGSLSKLFQILFASYSLNYAGPLKLGIPVRVLLFKRVLGVPYGAGIATVVVTTGLDVLITIVLALALLAWFHISPLLGIILGLASVIILTGLAWLFHKLPFARPKRPRWLASFLSDLGNLSPFTISSAIVISAIKSLLICLGSWIILVGLGGVISLAEFTLVYLTSHLAGLLSFIPMGIGIKDASLIELLSRLEISPSVGIVLVAIDRFIWSFAPLLIGLVAGWHLGISGIIKSAREQGEIIQANAKDTGRSLIGPSQHPKLEHSRE